jgi:hypothetical protein
MSEPGESGDGGSRDAGGAPSERRGGRRRSYNRRLDDREVSPPYYEIFERIAVALEAIEDHLLHHELKLPDAGVEVRERR